MGLVVGVAVAARSSRAGAAHRRPHPLSRMIRNKKGRVAAFQLQPFGWADGSNLGSTIAGVAAMPVACADTQPS